MERRECQTQADHQTGAKQSSRSRLDRPDRPYLRDSWNARPTTIGKTKSHGCIRLTNWDAVDLAAMVRPGTVVKFADEDSPVANMSGPVNERRD